MDRTKVSIDMARFAMLFLAGWLISFAWGLPVEARESKVVYVADGDSVTLETQDKKQVRVRFYGIDCPEYFQAYGQKARAFTVKRVMNQTVDFEQFDTDKDGRLVGLIRRQGKVLNRELIENGLAWQYGWFCKKQFCSEWKRLEEMARKKRIGLWADPNPTAPWDYRKKHPRTEKKDQKKSESKESPQEKTGFNGNVSSKVFHRPSCTYFNCKNCREHFNTVQEARKAGYRPCRLCQP